MWLCNSKKCIAWVYCFWPRLKRYENIMCSDWSEGQYILSEGGNCGLQIVRRVWNAATYTLVELVQLNACLVGMQGS